MGVIIMKKNFIYVLFSSLIWGSLITLVLVQPQKPIFYETHLSDELMTIDQKQHSYLMLNKEQKDERKQLELERIQKEQKRSRAKKLLLALFLPLGFKFAFLIPFQKLIGMSVSWTLAAATVPASMGATSIKMSVKHKRKKSKNKKQTNKSFRSKLTNFGLAIL